VRQPAKGHVDLAPINLIGGDESRQVEGGEMREDLRKRLPGVAFAISAVRVMLGWRAASLIRSAPV